jgi:hypothetical protein
MVDKEGSASIRTLSKRMYRELEAELRQLAVPAAVSLPLPPDALIDAVLATIRRVMRFDPDALRYTPELGRRMMAARRAKAASLGVSEYELRKLHRAGAIGEEGA